jgi:hypothetical protein
MEDRERLAREAVRKARQNLSERVSKEGSRRFFRARMERENPEVLVWLARGGDKDALEILRKYLRGLRKYGRDSGLNVIEVPPSLVELALEIFADGSPKGKSGTSLKDTGLRDLSIALLVRFVTKNCGFPESRNPEHRGEKTGPMSACRLVAEEVGLSEQRVEEIWRHHKPTIIRRSRRWRRT